MDLDAPLRTSTILRSLSLGTKPNIALIDVIQSLEDRSFAILFVVLGMLNCLPIPTPIPTLCGLLLLIFAFQMAFGMKAPWLPRRILLKSLSREQANKVISKALPIFQKLELWSKPRLSFMQSNVVTRVIGFVVLILSCALLFSIPFIGQIPVGFSICLIGLGLIERDGIVVVAGFVFGALSVLITLYFVYSVFNLLSENFGHFVKFFGF